MTWSGVQVIKCWSSFYAIDLDFDIILWLLCNKMLYPFVWPKVYQELRVYVSGQENMYSVEV